MRSAGVPLFHAAPNLEQGFRHLLQKLVHPVVGLAVHGVHPLLVRLGREVALDGEDERGHHVEEQQLGIAEAAQELGLFPGGRGGLREIRGAEDLADHRHGSLASFTGAGGAGIRKSRTGTPAARSTSSATDPNTRRRTPLRR